MKTLINFVLGLALFGFGGYFLHAEMVSPPTHSGHIYFFGAVAILGVLVIRPDPIFAVVKQVIVIAQPFIPVFGGRRAGDPPKEIEIPPKAEL